MSSYYANAQKKAKILKERGEAVFLAIETSCDETAAAVMRGFKPISSAVHTQIDIHKKYGGVVPEIASRNHVQMIDIVVKDALDKANMTLKDIEAIAVTYGPGLVGALLCGVSYAKALAYALDIPLFAINHIEGHICANYVEHEWLKPPFMCLVVSGGHSHIVNISEHGVYRLIGKTRDDAAGEAFDKAARVLGLPYPGGPEVDKLSKGGDPEKFPLPMPRVEGYGYSFSGLKTAMLQTAQRLEKTGGYDKKDAAASFQNCVTKQLTGKAIQAALDFGASTLAVAGGVAANSALRSSLEKECEKHGIKFCAPSLKYCTDNAVMIGAAANIALQNQLPADLSLNAEPSLRLNMIEHI
ncbi:MAG: tRNA (adenosine(37)-N6)-threonylcarbamoyltransferase complex transferase subunit TsaD [Clostridia bacterium]|nr:tRNA (adenosine(37)-N6)-threonylcarbamoyltransferase complex transferase subunit TsaD [Clostridia bacterium]